MEIVLKSSSPRRKELLSKMGYDFTIKVFDVDETIDLNKTPYENVKLLGYKKASVNMDLDYGKVLIGCDTIVVLDNKIYGKPKNEEEAFEMLKKLSGKKHQVMSGLCVIYKEKVYNDVEVSDVYFRDLTDEEIRNYIDTKEPFGKAGSYAIQGIGKSLVSHYDGSLNNIIGLPTEMLEKILGEIKSQEWTDYFMNLG